jgi:hypothetical protein
MLAKKCNENDLIEAAKAIGVEMAYTPYRSEGGIRFRLKPKSDGKRHPWKRFPYWRISASAFSEGRSVCAVCWHGHRDFYRALFELNPEARVYTALIRRARSGGMHEPPIQAFKGVTHWSAENFEDLFEATGAINIGSAYRPVCAADACRCESGETQFPDYVEMYQANQSRMTGECWLIQFRGLAACEDCEALDTPDCGGQNIRKTLKNEKGFDIPGAGPKPISRRMQ